MISENNLSYTFNIPEDWEQCKIGDKIKEIVVGFVGTVSSFYCEKNNGVLFLRTTNVSEGKINLKDVKWVSKDFHRLNKKSQIKNGDIIISRVGVTGIAALVSNLECEANCANVIIIKNEESDNVNRLFLTYFLNSDFVNKQVINQSAGGVQSVFNTSLAKNLQILLPPLPEQQKIAEILSTVDEKIEVIEAQINQTTELKKGLMQQLLTKGIGHTKFKDSPLGKIPESWEVVKLGELSEKVGSGITPKGGHEAYVERGVVFIRSQNVLRGKLDLSDVVFISEDQHIKMSNSWLRPNDVLLNITGASIGRSCIVPDDMSKGNVNQHVCIIRPNEKIIASYLSQLLNSKYGIDQIDKFQAGGNREGLNYQQIRSFVIPLPPKNEQLKIAGIVGTIDKKLESLELKRNYFNEFKKGLMQQLLTGKLRVNLNPSNHAAKSGDLQPTE